MTDNRILCSKVVTEDRKSVISLIPPALHRDRLIRTYTKDSIVTADPDTVGIMTFGSFSAAQQFRLRMERSSGVPLLILSVEGLGELEWPPEIIGSFKDIGLWFEHPINVLRVKSSVIFTPTRTRCFRKVRVLT